MVYISLDDEEFPTEDNPTKILSGDENVVNFQDVDTDILPGELYKWRVDCVDTIDGNQIIRRIGDTWRFTMI